MTTTAGYPTKTRPLAPDGLRALLVHRRAALFRPVEGDELDRLRASMAAGYDDAHPIVVWTKTGEIVDGRNRRDLALENGLATVPVAFVDFPNEEEVTRYVIQQNLARRHMSAKERADLAGRLVVNGTSVRQAAKTAAVSKSATQRAATKARKAAVPTGTPAKKRTAGADGKTYPATKPAARPPTKPPAKPAPKVSATKTRAQLQRETDKPLPPHVTTLVAQIDAWATKLSEVDHREIASLPKNHRDLVAKSLEQLQSAVDDALIFFIEVPAST